VNVVGEQKVTLEKAKELFNECGLELLEDEYISRTTKMKYKCSKHPNLIQYRSYQTQLARKGKCFKCAKEQSGIKGRRNFNKVIEVFDKLNLDLFEISFTNRNSVMRFRCRIHNDIIQERPYSSVESGYGCRICTAEEKSRKLSGENSGNWKGGLISFNDYLRNTLVKWKKEVLKNHNYKCFISGEKENLQIHHVKPFHEIRDEVLKELGFDSHFRHEEWSFDDFSKEELQTIRLKIKERHTLDLGYPITEELHREFHKLYGEKATIDDFHKFTDNFKKF